MVAHEAARSVCRGVALEKAEEDQQLIESKAK
jgi:hypothetical protein